MRAPAAADLVFEPVPLLDALDLNRIWHSRLPVLDRRVAGRTCYVAVLAGVRVAVAVWGLPVARLLPQGGSCLELRRFAIGPEAPRFTASRMLAWMARDLARRRPGLQRLVTYHDCDCHAGTIYRAAGWRPVRVRPGGEWDHPGRRRAARRVKHKVRWEKVVRVE